MTDGPVRTDEELGATPVGEGSLLDEETSAVGDRPAARPDRPSVVRGVLSLTPGQIVSGAIDLATRRPRLVGGAAALLIAGGAAGAWWAYRIEPPPDYETASMDTLFEYTLLTDDFNRLSVEERLELMGQLIERLRSISSSDSVLLAMFASMIMGEAREQLQENISRLMIDVSDKYAAEYDPTAGVGERAEYLEDVFLELHEMGRFVSGDFQDKSREELLDEGSRQAKRDLRRFEQGKVGADEVIRIFDVMNNEVGQYMSGHQKVRVSGMFRDMTEMLRSRP